MKFIGFAVILTQLAAMFAAGYGYITNIIKLVSHIGPFAAMEIVRAIGIVVPPVGVVMGYVG